jgi:hypothetical protein
MNSAVRTPSWRARGKCRATLLLLPVFAVVACHRHEPEPDLALPAASAAPVDRLAPGELIPGDKKAFAILLPREVTVDQALTEVVFASGPVGASDLANYVRARVRDGAVSVGASATVFDQVKAIDDPSRLLFIRIFSGPMGRGARMEVRNITPPPPQPNSPSPAERWKQMGLGPDGRVLDPTHLQ